MTRRYTKRGLWVPLHGEEVKRLWCETNIPAKEIGQMFGISKSAILSFLDRQRPRLIRSYITPSRKRHASMPVRGLNVEHVESDLIEISQYRHDTTRMLSCAANLCGVSVDELTGLERAGAKRKWRATYLMRRMGLSYPRIGRLVNRDHSTVQYGVNRFQATIDANRAAPHPVTPAEAVRG